MQKHAQTPDLHQQFGDAARSFLATIQIHVLVVLIRHLAAIARFLHGRRKSTLLVALGMT